MVILNEEFKRILEKDGVENIYDYMDIIPDAIKNVKTDASIGLSKREVWNDLKTLYPDYEEDTNLRLIFLNIVEEVYNGVLSF